MNRRKIDASNRKLARGCGWVMVVCLGGLLGIVLVVVVIGLT